MLGTGGPISSIRSGMTPAHRLARRLRRSPRLGSLALATVALVAVAAVVVAERLERSDDAPDFQLELFGNENYARGEVLRLSQFKGQPVIVYFWYPSCPPCVLEMPEFEEVFQRHRSDGLLFIGVQQLGLDSVEDGQRFVEENGITSAVGPDADGSIITDYKVWKIPHTVFLNKDHEITRTWTGVLNAERIEEIIGPLLQ